MPLMAMWLILVEFTSIATNLFPKIHDKLYSVSTVLILGALLKVLFSKGSEAAGVGSVQCITFC